MEVEVYEKKRLKKVKTEDKKLLAVSKLLSL
jgi:hypothetical protein